MRFYAGLCLEGTCNYPGQVSHFDVQGPYAGLEKTFLGGLGFQRVT